MKKLFLLASLILLPLLNATAQSWTMEHLAVDELLEIPAHIEYTFESEEIYVVIYVSTDNNELLTAAIAAGDDAFKSDNGETKLLVGLYDKLGNLQIKKEMEANIYEDDNSVLLILDDDLRKYLFENNGYQYRLTRKAIIFKAHR